MINALRAKTGRAPVSYLTEISTEELRKEYLPLLPETILGSEFLKTYKTHDDPVTTIQLDATYRVAGPTAHPIEENERVLKFMEAMRAAAKGDAKGLVTAGEMMYGAHESYKKNCRLSAEEVDFLVDAVRKRAGEAASLAPRSPAAARVVRSRFSANWTPWQSRFRR